MPIIAIINRKGGSGKSTLATHLAAYAANTGLMTMLGDIDRQHSSKSWLALRNSLQEGSRPTILSWAVDIGGSLQPPNSAQCVVLDTPGGLYGLALAKVVMAADVVLIPVCNSLFDRESAAMCIAELKQLPKIKQGRCKVAIVGMRIDSRSQGANDVATWAQAQDMDYIAHIRDTAIYLKCAEMGLTIFDLLPNKVRFDTLQWQPILAWLKPVFDAAAAHKTVAQTPVQAMHKPFASQTFSVPNTQAQATPRAPVGHADKKSLLQSLGIPNFLLRNK